MFGINQNNLKICDRIWRHRRLPRNRESTKAASLVLAKFYSMLLTATKTMNSALHFLRKLQRHAFGPVLVKRAFVISLVVGTILVLINHSAMICNGEACWFTVLQILLTMMVPYAVSTVSSVLAISDEAT